MKAFAALLKKVVFTACFVAAGALSPFSAWAASDDSLYIVQKVKADKTAGNAAAARDYAIAEARKTAYNTILDRVIIDDEKPKLPMPSNAELVNFISEMAVMNEKTSSVRYMADLDFRFNGAEVKKFLEHHNIGYINTVSDPVLLLPIYTDGKSIIFADGKNPWFDYLSGLKMPVSVVPLLLPAGDEDDSEQMQALLSGRYDSENIENLKKKYGAGKIVVAEMQEYDEAKNTAFSLYELSEKGLESDSFNFTVSGKGASDKIKAAAFATIRKKLEQEWKKDNVVYFSEASVITALIPLRDMSEWVNIKKKLDKMPIIEHYDLKAMKKDRLQVNIIFGRSIDRLTELMNSHNLILEPLDGGAWLLYGKKNTSSSLDNVPAEKAK